MLWNLPLFRPHNVILIPACYVAGKILLRNIINLQTVQTSTLLHLWLASIMYFSQGISNSLATIDVAAGYIGLSSYVPFIIGLQIFSHSYTFPVLSYAMLFERLGKTDRLKMLNILIVYRIFNFLYFCIMMLIQRNHLFIWSVFSPKLLIEASHTIFLLTFVTIFYVIKIITK